MIKTVQKKLLKGFTLIELLIVIAILGILAAAVLVAINPAKRTNQARDAGRKNDIGSLAVELQAYYTTPGEGQYPTGDGCGTSGNGLTTLTASGGLKQVPADPKEGTGSWGGVNTPYCYNVNDPTLTESSLYATLEDPSETLGIWCWRSATNVAEEIDTVSNCAP